MMPPRLVESGEEIHATCPICWEADRNEGALYISTQSGAFICFRCGVHGRKISDLPGFEEVLKQISLHIGDDFEFLRSPQQSLLDSAFRYSLSSDYHGSSHGMALEENEAYLKYLANLEFETNTIQGLRLAVKKRKVPDRWVDKVVEAILDSSPGIHYAKLWEQDVIVFMARGMQIYFVEPRKPRYLTLPRWKKTMFMYPLEPYPMVAVEGIWDAIALRVLSRWYSEFSFGSTAVAACGVGTLTKLSRIIPVIPDADVMEGKVPGVSPERFKKVHWFSRVLRDSGVKDAWDFLVYKVLQ